MYFNDLKIQKYLVIRTKKTFPVLLKVQNAPNAD